MTSGLMNFLGTEARNELASRALCLSFELEDVGIGQLEIAGLPACER